MNEKVSEVCGKVWHELGFRNGTATADQLARAVGEDLDLVNLALGWLAREEKVAFSDERNRKMFSLVESEMQIFRQFYKDGRPKSKNDFWKRLLQ